jgi:hypothetical protein
MRICREMDGGGGHTLSMFVTLLKTAYTKMAKMVSVVLRVFCQD